MMGIALSSLLMLLLLLLLMAETVAFSRQLSNSNSIMRLYESSSSSSEETPSYPWETPLDKDGEETLLQIRLSIQPQVDTEMALAKVQRYTQSFPFSAVLPVQPLQYLPTHEGGVEVLFLRKKTQDKGSVDGGMRFFIIRLDETDKIEIIVKRNSKGQTVSKSFTEKIVVKAYCDGIAGEADERTGKAPTEYVAVSSVFHKWM